jgi:mannose-6-phosphate isomerase-like protein (cupin superfamily)
MGELFDGEKTMYFEQGYAVFVPPNEIHQFRNNSKSSLRVICLIPYKK